MFDQAVTLDTNTLAELRNLQDKATLLAAKAAAATAAFKLAVTEALLAAGARATDAVNLATGEVSCSTPPTTE